MFNTVTGKSLFIVIMEYDINHFMTLTLQVRWMSGGRRNFIQQVIDNVKQEFTKNKEMKVCEEIETMILWL